MKQQSAAVPLRIAACGELELLLITSRGRSRWIVPKGTVTRGMSPANSAAKEAYEEAGVIGVIAPQPLGHYCLERHGANGMREKVIVEAYALAVHQEVRAWPEMHQRRRRWVSLAEGLGVVKHRELRKLLSTARLD